MDDLIGELKRRRANGSLRADDSLLDKDCSTLTHDDVDAAETALGFKLPNLLRSIYTEVANGGFGYAYGFLGLRGGPRNEDGQDSVGLYLSYVEPDPDDSLWQWPYGLLPIGHLGCAMYHCVQCTDPAGPVIWFEPNPHDPGSPWTDSFIPVSPSLADYLQGWLDGKELFAEVADGT